MVLLSGLDVFDQLDEQIIQRLPVEDAFKFYDRNKFCMTSASKNSFASAMKIPSGYFVKRNDELQKDMLLDAISEAEQDSLFILSNPLTDKLNFCASDEKDYKNPIKALNLNREGFIKIDQDYSRGRLKYFYGSQDPKKEVTEDFIPGVFITFPIFLDKKISFDVGMYRLVCDNGLMDSENCSRLTLTSQNFNVAMFDPLVSGIAEGLKGYIDHYADLIEFLKNKNFNEVEVRRLLDEYKETGVIPKGVIMGCLRHLNRMSNERKLPDNSPQTIQNAYDFVNLLTFYSHEALNSMNGKEQADRNIFKITHDLFVKETKKEGFKFNLFDISQKVA